MKDDFIPVAEPYVARNQKKYVNDCLDSNWISSLGKYITSFEQKFSRFIGCKHGIATSNGTTALHLALEALGVGKGDEVIVPDLTFVATANSVAYTGARPVFVDVNRDDWCINTSLIEQKITKKTKVIIPVHLYGNTCDMDKISDIAKKNDLFIIEDVAEAIGAEFKKKKAGSFSDVSCFSFYGNKIITTGEGGMCLTDDLELRNNMELLKDHGMSKTRRYYHLVRGFNYRMTNIQAAIGLAQLEDIDIIMEQRSDLSRKYDELLGSEKMLSFAKPNTHSKSVCWLYSLVLHEKLRLERDKFISSLKDLGIDSRPFFIPMHKMPFYKEKSDYLVSDFLSERGVNLPSSTNLHDEDIERVCLAIKSTIR